MMREKDMVLKFEAAGQTILAGGDYDFKILTAEGFEAVSYTHLSAQVDRVLQQSSGAVDEISFQLEQKTKGARNLFHNEVINGKKATGFDGLDAMLTGASTEYNKDGLLDISTSALMDSSYQYFLDMLDEFISGLDGKPDFLMCNSKLATKMCIRDRMGR